MLDHHIFLCTVIGMKQSLFVCFFVSFGNLAPSLKKKNYFQTQAHLQFLFFGEKVIVILSIHYFGFKFLIKMFLLHFNLKKKSTKFLVLCF